MCAVRDLYLSIAVNDTMFYDGEDQSSGEELSNTTTSEVDEQASNEGTSRALTSQVDDEYGSD